MPRKGNRRVSAAANASDGLRLSAHTDDGALLLAYAEELVGNLRDISYPPMNSSFIESCEYIGYEQDQKEVHLAEGK